MEFNKEQLAVINATENKILVSSGAGAGKSSTIVERVKKLIERGYDPTKIVVLSFTNAAADHIKELIGNKDVVTSTAHSYANQLLLKRGYSTNGMISEEKFDKLFDSVIENNINTDIDVLIVDECQDSTEIQFEFFEYLKPKEFMYFFDVKQSIFRWSGAYPEYLIELQKKEDVKTYKFTFNYRCGSTILEFARGITRKAGADYYDCSRCATGKKGSIIEKEFSIDEIIDILSEEENLGDWFILTRTNAQLSEIYTGLCAAGIECVKFESQKGLSYAQLQENLANPKLKIMTIHAAKGLQSKNVLVIGAKYFSLEEKCISYVAATRAIDKLVWVVEPKKVKRRKKFDGFENWS